MAAVTSALIAIAGVVLGWIAIEIACKPCLEKGREAIDRSLDPDYDPDDDEIRVPINPSNWSPTTTESTARPWFLHRLGFFSSKTSSQGCLILSFKKVFSWIAVIWKYFCLSFRLFLRDRLSDPVWYCGVPE